MRPPYNRAQVNAHEDELILRTLLRGPLSFKALHRTALPNLDMRRCDNAVRRCAAAGHIVTTTRGPKRWSITDAGRTSLGLVPLGARVGGAYACPGTNPEELLA